MMSCTRDACNAARGAHLVWVADVHAEAELLQHATLRLDELALEVQVLRPVRVQRLGRRRAASASSLRTRSRQTAAPGHAGNGVAARVDDILGGAQALLDLGSQEETGQRNGVDAVVEKRLAAVEPLEQHLRAGHHHLRKK